MSLNVFVNFIFILFFFLYSISDVVLTTNLYDNIGPTFNIQPPIRLDFTNNLGGRLDCTAKGIPLPNIEWFDNENSPVSSIQNVMQTVFLIYSFMILMFYE